MKQKKSSPLKKALFVAAALLPLAVQASENSNQKVPHERATITPTVGFRNADRPAVIIDAEFLWWYGEISNLSYAIKREVRLTGSETAPTQTAIVPIRKEEFDWDWNPGVRIGLGVITSLDGWDVYANWTYYHTSERESETLAPVDAVARGTPGTQMFTSPWFIQPNSQAYNAISARWGLDFNRVDLELGRNFWVSDELSVRPMAGVTGFWADLDFKVHANRLQMIGIGASTERSDFNQDSWGAGLLAGLSSAWHLTRHFSLYGYLEMALTYGKQSIKRNASINTVDQLGNPTLQYATTLRDDRYYLQPFIDLGMGIRFENTFDSVRAMLDAGWEFHSLLKFNQLFRGTRGRLSENDNSITHSDYPSTNGNLSLSGFVLKGRLEF